MTTVHLPGKVITKTHSGNVIMIKADWTLEFSDLNSV